MENTLIIRNEKGVDINPGMFGVFYEDINYACDGGINAQMIENGAFEFVEAFGYYNHYSTKRDSLYGWIAYPSNGDDAVLEVAYSNPVSAVNKHYLKFTSSPSQHGVKNKAYDGITLKEGMTYWISACLRSDSYTGAVKVRIFDSQKEVVCGAQLTRKLSPQWIKYTVSFKASKDVRHADFVIMVEDDNCTVEIDNVSMRPDDAVGGVLRRDILDKIKELNPGFMRFPGGCVVEGNELSNRYQWKNTIGDVENRVHNWNRWAVHGNAENDFAVGPFSHYNQSVEIGFYEYFLMCEYIGAKPLPVMNVGLACQYQSTMKVEPEDEVFNEYIKDALDLIEFANGDETSTYGKIRCSMGHKEPFNLTFLGIGNEQWETKDSRFFERYERFEKAIHDKYPDIKLIGSAGPNVTNNEYKMAWDFFRHHDSSFAYAVDEHYYCPPDWFIDNNDFYDKYPREVKVFAGEYAAHMDNGDNKEERSTLMAALSEAAFLTGVERNADVVVMASYAPLLSRIGYSQWAPNLIWFNDEIVYGTPSFYVQKLFSDNLGKHTLRSEFAGSRKVFHIVSKAQDDSLIIKFVNVADKKKEIKLEFDEGMDVSGSWKAYILSGKHKATNSVEKPNKVSIKEESIDLSSGIITLPENSMVVLRQK